MSNETHILYYDGETVSPVVDQVNITSKYNNYCAIRYRRKQMNTCLVSFRQFVSFSDNYFRGKWEPEYV